MRTGANPYKVRVMLVKDKARKKRAGPQIKSPNDVYVLLEKDIKQLDRESVHAIYLDSRNKVLGTEMTSLGTLNATLIHPRELFKGAILISAASIILVHNHPSGEAVPSEDDIEITKRVVKAGKVLGIDVLDHIIIGNGTGEYLSLKEYSQKKKENLFGEKY